MSLKLKFYKPPKWFQHHDLVKSSSFDSNKIPKYRYEFLDKQNLPTRIEKLNLRQLEKTKYTIYIKRDDLTHSNLQLQGNKLRKLEFLFADAVKINNAQHILTAGGLQSNHCRAVASISQMLNLKSHLFLRSHTSNADEIDKNLNGNLLINRLLGSKIYLIEKKAQYLDSILFKMNILKEKIENDLKDKCYIIPIGGSNSVGLFGYLEQFDEMIEMQNIDQFVDDIVITTGSGGTMSSLAIANYLTGSKFKLHAFCVCDNKAYFANHLIKQYRDLFNCDLSNLEQFCNIVECSKGIGYAQSTKEELEFLIDVFRQTGQLLDPVYTNKTLYTLVNLLTNKQPTLGYQNDKSAYNFLKNLKGNRILFVHTGGQLGLFDNFKFNSIFNNNKKNIFDCFNQNIDNIKV
jgi:D-cysteine desulfhydrase